VSIIIASFAIALSCSCSLAHYTIVFALLILTYVRSYCIVCTILFALSLSLYRSVFLTNPIDRSLCFARMIVLCTQETNAHSQSRVSYMWDLKVLVWCKKYPAVAGYFIKWTINGPKRGAKRRSFWLVNLWLTLINDGPILKRMPSRKEGSLVCPSFMVFQKYKVQALIIQ
jgi:hypothetical protein